MLETRLMGEDAGALVGAATDADGALAVGDIGDWDSAGRAHPAVRTSITAHSPNPIWPSVLTKVTLRF